MLYRQTLPGADTASQEQKKRERWLITLAVALGAGMAFMEALHPGILASGLNLFKDVVVAIWNMLCDFAAACGEFMRWVLHQRS